MAGAFTESLHPRGPAGTSGGGQFVSANASKGEAGGSGASEQKRKQVAAVQKLLGRPETGAFSPDDAAAVKKWQTDHHLTVDGVVGTQTLASLLGDDHHKPGPLSADDQKKLDDLAAGAKLPDKPAPAGPAPAKPAPAKSAVAKKPAHPATKKAPSQTSKTAQAQAQNAANAAAKKKPAPGKGQAAPGANRADHGGNPHLSEDGKRYWETGEGGAKVRWGTGGATRRCHRLVMQHAHFTDQEAWGYCAERHHAVTGRWPGQTAAKGGKGRRDELAPAQTRGAVQIGDDVDGIPAERAALAGQPETREVPFELESDGDGLNFSGYAAVFSSPTTIRDALGEFREQIAPGAFADSLRQRTPVLMFDHGKHPLIGQMPLGRITRAEEDNHGLYVEARLTDNWLIQPVRDAVAGGEVSGMSFRFTVPAGGDAWSKDGLQREIRAANVSELGPVVFPAYPITTASVRSALDHLDDPSGVPVARSAGRGREVAEVDEADIARARARRGRQLLLRGIR